MSWFMVTVEFQESKGRKEKENNTVVAAMQAVPTQEVLRLLNHILLLITSDHCQRCAFNVMLMVFLLF